MGLLGLAFHPRYADNGHFYVYYTREPSRGDIRSRVSRFTVSATNPDLAGRGSERVIMEFAQPFANHNAGDLHFGPSGYLHIASGDGGSGGDPQDNAQRTTTLLGKMLRIDVDNAPGPGNGPDCNTAAGNHYSIPPGNAFVDGAGGAGCDEVFALGLRNPWRFAFDFETGDLWVADVGQNRYEEVHVIPAGDSGGLNLGWRCFEGDEPFDPAGCDQSYLPPVHTYAHADSGCSVTGGRVYRGSTAFLLQGDYLFSDFCQSSIRALSGPPGNRIHRVVLPAGTLSAVSTFGEDSAGEVYVGELNSGNIYRLEQVPPPGC
jgi:glucose/arabinose dehydrogenase